ncbi:M13 family metallopeptidase [Brevundimonas subvibrioides]|uniref:Endothelin-converting enzyme 1 n=1 Tax=Brevundimonas subvibrioides (strain ATCC 15264 / DSM 4735 / LMG 14903 / NBRC 16000 / CB 81) TaxID=633149 RepID=D9QJG8_BRESC|nr:M13-type metalloendopeptidase [Brevundimonas subvibrioides]ADL01529.1 Endothelin-converting enzyme 1 [Brevundimonas subvibrioides ATCC 15264]
MLKLRLLACAASAALFVAVPALAQTAPVAVEIPSQDQAEIGVFGFDLNGMDTSVSPGADFNRYASGTYLANTPIPDDKTSYGVFDMLYDRSQANLRALVDESAANPTASPDAQRIGTLYGDFMDEAKVNQLGATPLQADLDEVRAADTREKLAALMGRTQSGFGASLFGIQTFEDLKDPDKVSAYVTQGGLGMPDRDYYLEDSFATQKAAYLAYVTKALELAGWSDPAGNAEKILAFETAIAGEHWTQVQNRQIDKIYNPTTLADLATAAPGFDWAGWAQGAGVQDVPVLIAANNTAFPGMARIFAETPIETLQAWEAFHIVDQAGPYLSQAFVDNRFDFYGKVLSGQPENRPRWKRGVTLVDGSLGESLGREYVSRHFAAESKAQMEALVANLMVAMRGRIERIDWMSDATKEQALYKLAHFGVKIGYPEQWRSYEGLNLVPGDLYGNVERTSAFEWQWNLGKLQRPVDPLEWGMTPQTVNAYYNPPRNEIVFPAAILQAPFFDPRADPAVNYGGIGAVIGHEITHGFDDQGRKTDGDGVLRDWWTAEDAARFEARAAVLGAQYSALSPVEGANVNGDLTMGENIADMGGLLLALDAYHLSLNGQPAPVLNGLTGDQRVFLGWAQVWRENARDEALRQQVTVDPHSPAAFRAGATVRNIDAWYDAFGVKPGDEQYLAPDARARIW